MRIPGYKPEIQIHWRDTRNTHVTCGTRAVSSPDSENGWKEVENHIGWITKLTATCFRITLVEDSDLYPDYRDEDHCTFEEAMNALRDLYASADEIRRSSREEAFMHG